MSHIPVEPINHHLKPKNNWATPIAIVFAGLLIAGAIFYRDTAVVAAPTDPNGPTLNAEAIRPVDPKTDHIRGDIKAPITIIEYSDLECPFCKIFHQAMTPVFDKYGKDGKVAWVYRHFPLDSIHQNARPEAIATECAAFLGGNDAFWIMHDKIFAVTTSNDGLDLSLLPTFAKEMGLDETKFNTCLKDRAIADKVETDYQNGLDIGVTGTPYAIMINNKTGEEIVIFKNQVPGSWGSDAENIMADILKNWTDILEKLRAGN